jgi:SAM-dependent methyltransferase
VLVDLLNDLGVLRFRAADPAGSLALIGHALALDPRHALAAKNKADIAGASAKQPKRWADGPDAKAQPTSLNAWTREALDLAQKEIGFTGKDILEVGGAIPPEAARATGARKWSACYLEAKPHAEPGYELAPADARRLPWSDASFDAVFSSCAFEHIQDLGTALGEMWRVLRPGGAIVTLFAPIWSYAVGHHLWETDARGERIMFLDPVIPRFGHLLLTEAELGWYLRIVLGETSAQRCTHYVYHHPCINRLFEGDFRRLFERSGFDASHLARQPVWAQEHVPSDRLNAELVRLHPAGGDFGTPGFRGVLTKVMPDARRRRTIESSQRTSTRAPSVPGR